MGGGPDDPVASPSLEPASRDAPAEYAKIDPINTMGTLLTSNNSCPATDPSSEVSVMTELDDAPPQSPRPDKNGAVGIESHENTEAVDTENEKSALTSREQDFANTVATEAQTVKADKQHPRLDPEFMIRQPDTRPVTHDRLVIEEKAIYPGLVMVEKKCIEVDNMHMLSPSDSLDVTRYLLMIPETRLILLQDGDMKPDNTVRTWFIKVQKDPTEEDRKYSNLQSNNDSPATPEEAPSHLHVSDKTATQVFSPDDCLHGFLVALELRAKELGWPEYEELVALTAAEIGEEGRKKVMDEQYYLDIGYDLVNQFLQDFETAKVKVEKKAAEAKEREPVQEDYEALTWREAQQVAQEKEKIAQQATYKETSAEEGSEVIGPEEAEVISKDAEEVPKEPDQEANLFAQEPQAFEEAGVAAEDRGKERPDTGVGTVVLTQEAKPKSKKRLMTKRPPLVENRPLHNQSLYKKVGKEYWLLVEGQWTISRHSEQWAAMFKLHCILLNEHHDFLQISQHPIASAALKRLPAKYVMPARMWKHGIHSFLEVMCVRLSESHEFMESFIILGYCMICLLDETIPQFRSTWIECKADLARYGLATEDVDMRVKRPWRDISKEQYTRALAENCTIGRIYHHLAILERPRTSSPNEVFDATVSQLFYYTKSLIVKTPYYPTRKSVLTVINPIVDRNKEAAEKSAGVPQTDKDHFLTAVVHLILASLEPETQGNGYQDTRKDHLQAVYAALENIKVGRPAMTPRIRPSAKLGLLLCHLLLGIPLADKKWSPMMAAWGPDFITAEDRTDSNAMAYTSDINNATIELIRTMIPYLLKEADTRDLELWGFIYVILVFMRSLKTRPALLGWFGLAFHPEVLAPFLNMLLREDETRGGTALESASQSELVTVCSLLNDGKRRDKYESSTEDNIERCCRDQEEKQKAERAKGTAKVEEAAAEATPGEATEEDATAPAEETVFIPKGTHTMAKTLASSDAAHERDRNTKIPKWERMYANLLPEHSLLLGLFFAREAEPSPEVTQVDVQTAEEPAVEAEQEISLTDSETDNEGEDGVSELENEAEDEKSAQEKQQTEREVVEAQLEMKQTGAEEASLVEVEKKESENQGVRQKDTQTKERDCEKMLQEDEQKVIAEEGMKEKEERKEREAKETEEAEVWRHEGLYRDPPLFPNGWFKNSKYDFEELQVFDYVQNAETYYSRSEQILRLAAQLNRYFFVFEVDEKEHYWISVPGALSIPKFDESKKLPQIVERESGVRVVYVHPSSHAAEIERENRMEEIQREERERQKDQEKADTTDDATVVDGEARNNAEERPAQSERSIDHVDAEDVNIPAETPSTIPEDEEFEPVSATAAEKPSSTHDAEPTAEAETMLPIQGGDDSKDAKGSDSGPDAAAATVPAEGPATSPQATVELIDGVLDKMPGMEDPTKAIKRWRAPSQGHGADEGMDDEGWTRVSNESHNDSELSPTVQTAQADTRSIFSRLFGW